jgi:asparagine synthetase B (glutamine-hydrolysing)
MSIKSNFLISIEEKSDKSDFADNIILQNNYVFDAGKLKISLKYSDNVIFAKSADENIIILFAGNIYSDDISDNDSVEQYLLDNYFSHKKDFVKYLNGSFSLFFAQRETGEVYFATDRLNTRKIFKFKKGGRLLFANDINLLPLNECNLNYAGLASYLINGALYNDLTLFDEIKKLERASLHKIVDFNIISEKYSDYYFNNEYENKSETELADELNNLYLQSLNRIIKGKKNIFISLSGGYDSRAITAMLKKCVNSNFNIICFSHNFGNINKDTDSDIARQIAENLGYPFRLINSYERNPFHTFKYNAEHGQGMAYFCVESDAWEEMNKDFEKCGSGILLVGDMNDGTFKEFHGNNKRALERTQIYESFFLKEYRNYFSPDILQNLCENWDREYDKILNRVSQQDNMINLLDYLYIDQRIPNVNSVARECFQAPYIETATPFYDNNVLDFMGKLPPSLRNNKKLHRMALEKNYPDIFKIKFPTSGWGNEPDWINEIKSFSDVFIDNIKNSKSKLDNIIPPGTIIKSILALNNPGENKFNSKTTLKSLHKNIKNIFPAYYKIIENLPGGKELTRKAGKFVNPRISHILPKILLLRLFLSGI